MPEFMGSVAVGATVSALAAVASRLSGVEETWPGNVAMALTFWIFWWIECR